MAVGPEREQPVGILCDPIDRAVRCWLGRRSKRAPGKALREQAHRVRARVVDEQLAVLCCQIRVAVRTDEHVAKAGQAAVVGAEHDLAGLGVVGEERAGVAARRVGRCRDGSLSVQQTARAEPREGRDSVLRERDAQRLQLQGRGV